MSAYSIENRKVLGPNAESFDDDQLLKKMTAYAKKHFDGIKEGDVVSIEYETGYRNQGVFIWNGKKVVNLYTKLDDYGSVPPEIEISDDNNLDAYSWEGLIDHNKLVWYSPEIRDRIKNNLNDDYTAQVDIRGKTWNFILHDIHDEETGTEHTVEQLKKALPKNIIAFDTEDHSNNVYMYFTYDGDGKPLINGKPRRPKQNAAAAANKTKRVSSKENASPKTTTRRLKIKNVLQSPHIEPLQVDHQETMQITIARVEAELAAARENVAQLERQLTAVHLDVLNLKR